MARKATAVLADNDLTLDRATKLYRLVESGAQGFDEFFAMMEEQDVDDALIDAAEAVEEIWSHLSLAAANRVRVMRGLELISVEDD